MNKQELAERVAEQFELSKRQASQIIDSVFADIMNAVKSGREASIAGFGNFKLAQRKARQGINPKTMERISIAAKRVAKFKPAKAFSELVR